MCNNNENRTNCKYVQEINDRKNIYSLYHVDVFIKLVTTHHHNTFNDKPELNTMLKNTDSFLDSDTSFTTLDNSLSSS